jgi:hypothetical protein
VNNNITAQAPGGAAPEVASFATLRARYALAGFSLLELPDSSLVAARWGRYRTLPDVTAAHRFLRLIGGAA